MKVIDFRVRPPLKGFLSHFIYKSHTQDRLDADQQSLPVLHRNRHESKSALERSLDLFIEELDRAKIDHAVVLGRDSSENYGASDNGEIADFCASSQGRFSGFAGISSTDTKKGYQEIRKIRQRGLLGACFDSGFSNIHQDDPSLWPLYDAVAQEGLPLVLTASMLLGEDMTYAHPDRVRTVAKRYPQTKIIVAHACWPWTTLACAIAYENPNIYLLPDCYMNTNAPGTSDYVHAANTFMEDRMLYGSAYPVRPLADSLQVFNSLPLTETARRRSLWDNAAGILNIS
ncbi:amidohydrolase family protein [Advenella sp. FME57]|uniref:amidohydrolase family protein n=1 Tax=Advenella sp. FME57 TaxID=2742604 RepID=UPI00186708E2|nr:amidohydrolase family protein [Advenella sp. FME57]